MGNAKAYAALYYPNDHNDTKAKELLIIAVNGFRLVKRRQEFLYKTERKIDAAVELINEFKLKTIMFSQSTSFADEVALRLGSSAVSYHSGIKTTEQLVTTTTVVKTKKAVDKLVMSDPKAIVKVVIEGYEVTTSKLKKIGPAKYLAKAMDDFTNNLNGVSTICTAKALDTGMDVPDVELGIDASRTSNPTQKIQRTGRVARNYTYEDGTKKRGVYINLYIPNSQDESWLKSCQSKNPDSVIWIDDIDEVKTFVHNLLKK
jgi:superfamily II DNA or RNA helicase